METRYFINAFLEVDEINESNEGCSLLKKVGNFFATREECTRALQRVKLAIYEDKKENNCR